MSALYVGAGTLLGIASSTLINNGPSEWGAAIFAAMLMIIGGACYEASK